MISKCFFRFEEVPLCHLQSIWTDTRNSRHEDSQDARTGASIPKMSKRANLKEFETFFFAGIRGLQGDLISDERHAFHAGLPFLRQAYENCILQGGLGHHRKDEGNLPG